MKTLTILAATLSAVSTLAHPQNGQSSERKGVLLTRMIGAAVPEPVHEPSAEGPQADAAIHGFKPAAERPTVSDGIGHANVPAVAAEHFTEPVAVEKGPGPEGPHWWRDSEGTERINWDRIIADAEKNFDSDSAVPGMLRTARDWEATSDSRVDVKNIARIDQTRLLTTDFFIQSFYPPTSETIAKEGPIDSEKWTVIRAQEALALEENSQKLGPAALKWKTVGVKEYLKEHENKEQSVAVAPWIDGHIRVVPRLHTIEISKNSKDWESLPSRENSLRSVLGTMYGDGGVPF